MVVGRTIEATSVCLNRSIGYMMSERFACTQPFDLTAAVNEVGISVEVMDVLIHGFGYRTSSTIDL